MPEGELIPAFEERDLYQDEPRSAEVPLEGTAVIEAPSPPALPTSSPIPPSTGKKVWRMKKLSRKHKEIAGLLLSGEKHEVIAELSKCTKQYIVMLKSQPLFQEYMKELEGELSDEFRGLFSGSIGALRDGLRDDKPIETRLKASRLVLESQGKLKGTDTSRESAEDVAQRLVQQYNVQINIGK